MAKFSVSERFACKVLGQHRSTQRKKPQGRPDEEALTSDIIRLASRYGRYGYRRITAMLRSEGWTVNAKRVERIWRREGLKVPQKQPKKGRLWLNDGSCIRLRPEHPNHVWSYDFVEGRTHDGRRFRMLNIIDEFTRECLAIRIDRKLNSTDVIDALSDLFILRGVPGHVRSDNGPEFTSRAFIGLGLSVWHQAHPHPARPPHAERLHRKLRRQVPRRVVPDATASTGAREDILQGLQRVRPHGSIGLMPREVRRIAPTASGPTGITAN